MTQIADQLRDRRRADALPGGPRDRRIALLWRGLPVGVGMMLAVMIVTPMFPRGEVSFLLDRTKVAMTSERLAVNQATYRGADDQGRAFALSAGQAVQHSASVPLVAMRDLVATMQMKDGPTQLAAKTGEYEIDKERVTVSGPVQFSSQDGYRLTTSSVAVDLKARHALGTGVVNGMLKSGTFSADSMAVDLSERKVTLQGRAHLRMVQGAR